MMRKGFLQDLVVLCADGDAREALRALLARPDDLGIRPITVQFDVHLERDPGCYLRAQEFLRPFLGRVGHVLVSFDREGCGQEHRKTREALERDVETRLAQNGWMNNSAAIAFDPEVEAWAWCAPASLEVLMRWSNTGSQRLFDWLEERGFTMAATARPDRPKEALLAALRRAGRPRSSSLFGHLGGKADLDGCSDAAFVKFRQTLQRWFPPHEGGTTGT
jgi:hypothetical protein